MISESRREGLLDHEEHELLTGALQYERVHAHDLVLGPDQLITVDRGVTAGDVEDLVAQTGFSRFPVRGDDALDGYLHVKDVLDLDPGQRVPGGRIRALPHIAADATVDDILTELQRTGSHLGLVTRPDTVLGVVALEDAIEELIGEVVDAAHTGVTA